MNVSPRWKTNCGHTLIELAVVLSVMGIVAGVGTGVVVEGGRAYRAGRSRSDAVAEADYVLRRLAAELRRVAGPDDITAISETAISFRVDGTERTFALNGTTVVRNSTPIAHDVTVLSFSYFKADGSLTTDPVQVHRIAAEIAVVKNGLEVRLRTEMFPRSFRSAYESWEDE